MKKLLLIEDNKEISENIKSYLELEDYKVDTAFSWDIGIDKALVWNYDLILLDLMLPVIDGFSVCEKLSRKISAPIIMITAKDSIDDKLKWFETGTLDYIVKPFDLRELDARINTILNRVDWISWDVFKFEDLEISIKNRVFKKDGKDINITQKEFLILEALFNNIKAGISRTDIIDHVWGESSMFDWDAKLDVYISSIRSKLSKTLIKTIKWFWYRINN